MEEESGNRSYLTSFLKGLRVSNTSTQKINFLRGYIPATTLGLFLLDLHTKQKYDPEPPGPTLPHQTSVHGQQHLQINFKKLNNEMYMINPGKTILSKGSFPSRSNCSAHHFSADCSMSCALKVSCLMSVSMTAEMTTSQNRRSDSQTAAAWIMFTCCQAAGIFLLALPRHRTSGTLLVKSLVGLTL